MSGEATALADIELVISDVDGTLVRDDKSLSPKTIEAVKRLGAAGIGFTLISARPPSGLGGHIADLGLATPVGAFNGATVFEPDGTIVEAHHLGQETARGVASCFDGLDLPYWIFADGRWMTRTRAMPHVEQEIVAARQEPVVAEDLTPWLGRADKLQAVCDDPARLAEAERAVKARFSASATIAKSQTYYLDVTAPKTDKGHGVTELAKAFGIPLAAVAVAGDMPNDLSMFRVAGLAVAMGQAPDEVKAEADHVTTSNEADGLAAFIEALLAAKDERSRTG
ncbi:hypothetical protein GCM10011390_09490 [Aureimonas endophytica]|uniref:Cof subfamily protein (Haloacid dehalogenase superfamily)/HAD superfamily hydrolase (TIGR01484 family) n=2 Tax=Aureimonas endophytica TaxID=2027858 RepID=A0A917E0X7_9HYPH|nr:hypothetical protein GCM10011390_09490 [Aureimonas endophytica]